MHVTIDAGAADVTVRLPKDVGVRVVTDPGAAMFETHGLTQNDGVCTNAAYGVPGETWSYWKCMLQLRKGALKSTVSSVIGKARSVCQPVPARWELYMRGISHACTIVG